jgi:hypothetical protein
MESWCSIGFIPGIVPAILRLLHRISTLFIAFSFIYNRCAAAELWLLQQRFGCFNRYSALWQLERKTSATARCISYSALKLLRLGGIVPRG